MSELDYSWWAGAPSESKVRQNPVGFLAERGVNVPPETPTHVLLEILRVVTLIWCDGRILPIDRFSIDPADEGLLFGRGVWESSRTQNGVPWLWNWHLDRLRKTAEALHIAVDSSKLPDAEAVARFVRTLTKQDVVIRLNATAGRPGGKGLIWMTASLLPMPKTSIRLKSARNPAGIGNPYLLWKTFQYSTRLRVGQEAAKLGFDSALLVNANDELLEAAHANIFLKIDGEWWTPKVNGEFLPGTVRQFLLQQSPIQIREKELSLGSLDATTEVFVTNSNIGIVPVTQIDSLQFNVGPDTQSLSKWLNPPSPGGVQWRVAEKQSPIR